MTTLQERLEGATASHETAALRMNQLLDQLDEWSGLPSIIHYGIDTGAANALVATVVPPIAAYVDGQVFAITPANTSTTMAPTININGRGVKSLVYPDNSPLAPGDIIQNAKVLCGYDATLGKVVLLARSQAPGRAVRMATAGGTANAITLTDLTPSGPFRAFDVLIFRAAASNTGAVTIAGLTTKNSLGNALAAGEIISGLPYMAIHDGAGFLIVNATAPTISSALSTPQNIVTFPVSAASRIVDFSLRYRTTAPTQVGWQFSVDGGTTWITSASYYTVNVYGNNTSGAGSASGTGAYYAAGSAYGDLYPTLVEGSFSPGSATEPPAITVGGGARSSSGSNEAARSYGYLLSAVGRITNVRLICITGSVNFLAGSSFYITERF